MQRCNQQALEFLLYGIAGEFIEESGEVFANLGVGGQEAEVFINATGLRVVVSRSDMTVVAQHAVFVSHHEGELAVRLQADEAVHNMHASLLQLARPGDVGFLVEARLNFDEREHLFTRLGRVDQCFDDGTVARRAVQRLLDREHVRVGRGLLKESLHAGRK